jgi:hypothetical protein
LIMSVFGVSTAGYGRNVEKLQAHECRMGRSPPAAAAWLGAAP